MKKHLIAAAVAAAVSVPAMAQSSVEVYGIVDLGYSSTSSTVNNIKAKSSGINNGVAGLSSSRLGFRGTEDLGGGLKAGFVLEQGLDTDSTSSIIGTTSRAANVSLSGGFGTVRVGRQDSPGKAMIDTYTAFGGGGSFHQGSVVKETAEGRHLGADTQAGFMLRPTVDRASNALAYVSPNFNGLTVTAVAMQTKEDNVTTTSPFVAGSNVAGENKLSGYALKGDYVAGGLSLSAAYTTLDQDIEAGAQGREMKMTQAGAKYAIGAATVFGLYTKGEYTPSAGGQKLDTNSLDIGVTYTIGATTLLASVGQGEIDQDATKTTDLDGYQLQARYALSKRTTAYAIYGKTTADVSATREDKSDVMMVGMRHSF